jgi:hypothetical protein
VGNDNIDVGKNTPTRKPSELRIDKQDPLQDPLQNPLQNPLKAERPRTCVAMAQQCGDLGRDNASAPQKFVQLIGCRDRNARPDPWVRPRATPVKR